MNTSNDNPLADRSTRTPGPYALVGRSVLTDARLTVPARLLYVLLDSRQTSSPSVRVSQTVLATDLGVSVRTVKRLLGELVAVGLLQWQRTGRTSTYRLTNEHRQRPPKRQPTGRPRGVGNRAIKAAPEGAHDRRQQWPDTGATSELKAALCAAAAASIDLGTTGSRKALQAALGRGWTIPQIAGALNGTNTATARNPGAVLFQVLKGLSISDSPAAVSERGRDQLQIERAALDAVLDGGAACIHGEPRGPSRCALCRRAADVAVGIAAALEPTKESLDMAARDALADVALAAWEADPELVADSFDTEQAGSLQRLLVGVANDLALDRQA